MERDREVASAVLANPYTRVLFRVGDADARALENGLSFFEARDLQNLDRGQAIARVEKADFDFNLTVSPPKPVDPDEAQATRQRVVAASRAKYALARRDVADMLRRASEGNEGVMVGAANAVHPAHDEPAESRACPGKTNASIDDSPSLTDTDSTDSRHTAIKNQIATEAEGLEYTVTFEGSGCSTVTEELDVTLRRGNQAIACEVSVTNTVEYEVGNILKCGRAGFQHIAMVCRSQRIKLTHIQELLAKSAPSDRTYAVDFYTPEKFISDLL